MCMYDNLQYQIHKALILNIRTLEMQQYIDALKIVIYRCIDIKAIYLYMQYFMTDAVAVYCGCQCYSSATI